MDGLPIQPLASAIAATNVTAAQQSAHRAAQARRDHNRLKVSSIDQMTLERQVESAEAVDAVHDKPEDHPSRQPKHRHPRDSNEEEGDDPPHIDLTA